MACESDHKHIMSYCGLCHVGRDLLQVYLSIISGGYTKMMLIMYFFVLITFTSMLSNTCLLALPLHLWHHPISPHARVIAWGLHVLTCKCGKHND